MHAYPFHQRTLITLLCFQGKKEEEEEATTTIIIEQQRKTNEHILLDTYFTTDC